MNELRKIHWNVKLGACSLVAALIVLLTQHLLFDVTPLQDLEMKFLDARFKSRGEVNIKDASNVIIVEITQESYDEIPSPYNAWPWPRKYFAKLIENLNNAGAKAIGIDLLMSEPDRFSPENDSILFEAIRKAGNVVLAGKIDDYEQSIQVYTTNDDFEFLVQPLKITVKKGRENYSNIFFDADSSIGIVQIPSDNDGVFRRYMPFAYSASSEERIPSFGFAILNKYFKKDPSYTAQNFPGYFLYEEKQIPKFDKTSMLINFYGAYNTFPHYKFIDIIDDRDFKTVSENEYGEEINIWDDPEIGYLNSGIFKDKIVIIGSTLPQDKDIFSVSISKGGNTGDNMLYGVEIHANLIHSVLSDDFLYKLPQWIEILIIVLLTFFTFYTSSKIIELKIKYTFVVQVVNIIFVLVLGYLFYTLSFMVFSSYSYILPVVSPLFAVVLGNFSSTAYTFILERRKSIKIKKMFGYYVNKSLVNELMNNSNLLRLGGERKELSILFSDIAGFSTFSEQIKPEELVYLLNDYLSSMTEIVLKNNGTLDKYVGDAVMAFWGAPLPDNEHAYKCCLTAIEMQKKLKILRNKWNSQGSPDIVTRIGINTGEMVVGNIGGFQRFDYTVIGDNVNLASRMEGANKFYGTEILITKSTYDKIKERIYARELDNLIVKGKTLPVKVYELVDLIENINTYYQKFYSVFAEGLSLYEEKKFQQAKNKFKIALTLDPADYPSKLYFKRCEKLINEPPKENWKAVVTLDSK